MSGKLFASAIVAAVFAAPLAVNAQTLPKAPVTGFLAACQGRSGWTDAAPPAQLFGNTYNVGTCGITSLLVVSTDGLVLIDSGPPEAAPLVLDNIRKLGFDIREVKWILMSHEHADHVGGVAEIQRATGAQVAALETAKAALETGLGDPADPQRNSAPHFQGFHVDRVLQDGDRVTLGDVVLTAHSTPVHSPGSTSWTWRSCDGAACLAMAYADSASTISAKGYRFSDHPDYVAHVRSGIGAIAALDCDILITPHPEQSDLHQRLADKTLVGHGACVAYAKDAQEAFDERLAEEAEKKS